ncbi:MULTISPECIES: hypothetical protein [unclassified Streptomyces]|uniref:hypothetical protein n=1 Tax=unclassified Streptomyces TaxID=2593676 RepID=UPI00224E64E4|nr:MULTISPECIES: hypothetical protein [unclassified Streptomyces]MCX4527827.1 hypothetical protein [Streptomyces sp. NBC_01551]MCX4541576.1 hypothetical protein [Streptomyces sp. NBC_01565]
MLRARSSSEAHLYMDLHPCECGGADFERRHHLEQHGDDLVAVYEGVCRNCGRERRFEFVMAVEIPPPPPAYGGAEPSAIIDPGEFSDVADRYRRWAGTGVLNSPESERHKYRGAMASALAAVEEVLKFIPEGQDAVPASAFTSARGRARYEKDPEKFSREFLEIERRVTIRSLAVIDRVARSSGGADPAAE